MADSTGIIGAHKEPCRNILYSKRDIVPMRFDIIPTEWYNKFNKDEEALVYGYDVRKEASTLWGISTRRVTTLCSAGKIPGASKENGSWQIPANAEKPADARVRTGAYKIRYASTSSSLSAFPIIALHRRNTTMSIKR